MPLKSRIRRSNQNREKDGVKATRTTKTGFCLSGMSNGMVPIGGFPVSSPLGYFLLSRPAGECTPIALVADRILAACQGSPIRVSGQARIML
jgi:hypothetical protein